MRRQPNQVNSFAEGMNKDKAIEFLQPNEYVHAQNMEIVNNEQDLVELTAPNTQGNSFRLTTSKGNTLYISVPQVGGEDVSIIGHGKDGRTLVLFTTQSVNEYPGTADSPNDGQVWYVDISNTDVGSITLTTLNNLVYNGALNFSLRHEIHKAQLVNENDCIIRCTWTDNYNPVRTMIVSEGLVTVDAEVLSINPGARWSTLTLDSIGPGTLTQGVYQYTYRYVNEFGVATPWFQLTNPINLFASSHPNWFSTNYLTNGGYTNYFATNARDNGEPSGFSVTLEIADADTRFSKVQFAYLYFVSNPGEPIESFIFEELTVSGSTITVTHDENGGEPISAEELLFQGLLTIDKCQDILNINQRMLYAGYSETGNVDFDKSSVTIDYTTEDFRGEYASQFAADFLGQQDFTRPFEDSKAPQPTVGYWRDETYRFGIVFWYRNGGIGFAEHLGDFTFPTTFDEPLVSSVGSAGPAAANAIELRRLGAEISGIDVSAFKDLIYGFSIVRAKRAKKRVAQGIFATTGLTANFSPLVGLTPDEDIIWCSPDTDSEWISVDPSTHFRTAEVYLDNPWEYALFGPSGGATLRSGYLADTINQNLTTSPVRFPQITVVENGNRTVGENRLPLVGNRSTNQYDLQYQSIAPPFTYSCVLWNAEQTYLGYPDLEDTIYQFTGHFQRVDESNTGTGGTYVYDNQIVWGGDCHVNLYGRFIRQIDDDVANYRNFSIFFPVQSEVNPTYRWMEVDPEDATRLEPANIQPMAPYDKSLSVSGQTFGDVNEAFLFNSNTWRENNIRLIPARPEDYDNCLQERPGSIISSRVKVPGEDIDSHAILLPNETKDLDLRFGPITSIVARSDGDVNQIYAFQETAFANIPVEQYNLQLANAGEIALGTGRYFGQVVYISQNIGCKHIHSITRSNETFYWVDILDRSLWRFAQDGLVNLGQARGMGTWFKNNLIGLSQIDNPIFRGGIHTGYDFNKQTLYITSLINTVTVAPGDVPNPVLPSGYNPDWTLSFNEVLNKFVAFHTFVPNHYISLSGNRFLSLNPNDLSDLYLHDSNTNRNRFYGSSTSDEAFVVFVVNTGSLQTKRGGYFVFDINDAFDSVEIVQQDMKDVFNGDTKYRGELPFFSGGRRVFIPKGNKYLGPMPICTDRYLNGLWLINNGMFPIVGEEIFVKLATSSEEKRYVTYCASFFTESLINT